VAYLEGQSIIQTSNIPGASTLPLVGTNPPAIPDQHLMNMFIECMRSKSREQFVGLIGCAQNLCVQYYFTDSPTGNIPGSYGYLSTAHLAFYPPNTSNTPPNKSNTCLQLIYDAYHNDVPSLDINDENSFRTTELVDPIWTGIDQV
jgi:hypothetical protein